MLRRIRLMHFLATASRKSICRAVEIHGEDDGGANFLRETELYEKTRVENMRDIIENIALLLINANNINPIVYRNGATSN